ncbi:MAG: ferritin [Actinomycetota bacterium]
MALDEQLEAALNAQVTMEYGAAYSYFGMSAWFEAEGLPGMAQWMRAQAAEELTHAEKFYQYVLDRGGRIDLGPIEAPQADFTEPIDVFNRSLEQEQEVTASINDLYAMAVDLKDFASLPLLDWFVAEQVEEEASVGQIIDDLTRGGDSGHTILMLDRELGARQSGEGE